VHAAKPVPRRDVGKITGIEISVCRQAILETGTIIAPKSALHSPDILSLLDQLLDGWVVLRLALNATSKRVSLKRAIRRWRSCADVKRREGSWLVESEPGDQWLCETIIVSTLPTCTQTSQNLVHNGPKGNLQSLLRARVQAGRSCWRRR
jgi:hypothetical protein